MIGSKLVPFVRLGLQNGFKAGGQRLISTSTKRMSDAPWTYREFSLPEKKFLVASEVIGGIFWWWVFWNLFTEYEHIIGHFKFPKVGEWTDAELGIPPDDAEDPE